MNVFTGRYRIRWSMPNLANDSVLVQWGQTSNFNERTKKELAQKNKSGTVAAIAAGQRFRCGARGTVK